MLVFILSDTSLCELVRILIGCILYGLKSNYLLDQTYLSVPNAHAESLKLVQRNRHYRHFTLQAPQMVSD